MKALEMQKNRKNARNTCASGALTLPKAKNKSACGGVHCIAWQI